MIVTSTVVAGAAEVDAVATDGLSIVAASGAPLRDTSPTAISATNTTAAATSRNFWLSRTRLAARPRSTRPNLPGGWGGSTSSPWRAYTDSTRSGLRPRYCAYVRSIARAYTGSPSASKSSSSSARN